MEKSLARVQWLSGPDRFGMYSYFLFWPTNYIPGHPDGEHGQHVRGQGFYNDAKQHGDIQEGTMEDVRRAAYGENK